MAEREGFEPSIPEIIQYNGLANRRFRPLSHLSAWTAKILYHLILSASRITAQKVSATTLLIYQLFCSTNCAALRLAKSGTAVCSAGKEQIDDLRLTTFDAKCSSPPT